MLNPILCKEVMVKFKDQRRTTEIISTGEVDATDHLKAEVENGILQVSYMLRSNTTGNVRPLKTINYVLAEIYEWTCNKLIYEDVSKSEMK